MGRPLVGVALVFVLIVAGCGAGDESRYTREEIASALGFRTEHHEVLYERAPGKDCVVLRVLTDPDEIEVAVSGAPDLPSALAVNADGDAAIMFAGFGDLSQEDCIAPAEADLDSLSD